MEEEEEDAVKEGDGDEETSGVDDVEAEGED